MLVNVNIREPLIPGTYFATFEDRSTWVSFGYEKVFKFCKRCGKVGHSVTQCFLTAIQASEVLDKKIP